MADLSSDYYIVGTPRHYIYEPNAGYTESEDSLANEESGRTDDGKMHITWVRTSYLKWEFTYQGLTAAEYNYMRNLLQGKTFTFCVELPSSPKSAPRRESASPPNPSLLPPMPRLAAA